MSKYIRLTRGVNDPGILINPSEIKNHVKNNNIDHYTSIHYYNSSHFEQFKKTGSIKKIVDVTTDHLAFDFDSKADLELARQDALTLISNLRTKFNISPNNIEVYFSGQKGFTVNTKISTQLPPYKIAHLALNVLGKGLKTLDKSLYNPSRILRLPNTKHQHSGLFKVQLSYAQLQRSPIDEIKEIALQPQELRPLEGSITIPEDMLNIPEEKTSPRSYTEELDLNKKPSQWKNCKWNLMQGNFKTGERHNALMVLASTCRGLSFTKDMTYDLCRGALDRSIAKYGESSTTEEELREHIIEDIFSDNWEGGQYSCKKPGWLQSFCDNLGEHKCKDRNEEESTSFVKFDDMFTNLVKFSQDFEKNIIKTGLVQLDEKLILSTSTLNGVLGQPGSGKTTMAMNYLKHSSKMGIPSIFFSLDMGLPIVTSKIIQQRTGLDFIQALNFVKEQPEEAKILADSIMKEDYANVNFTFKSGITANDMKEMIKQQEEKIGKKVKLVVVDYLECISSQFSDSTASTGYVANLLKDIANELEVCILLLLQTQKHSTPEVSDPLLSLKGVKGSSVIEQSCTSIFSLWREGYSPKYAADDRYISFAVVKNRFGTLWSGDFSWDGVTGSITSMTEEQRQELKEFRKRKRDDKLQEAIDSNKQWE